MTAIDRNINATNCKQLRIPYKEFSNCTKNTNTIINWRSGNDLIKINKNQKFIVYSNSTKDTNIDDKPLIGGIIGIIFIVLFAGIILTAITCKTRQILMKDQYIHISIPQELYIKCPKNIDNAHVYDLINMDVKK